MILSFEVSTNLEITSIACRMNSISIFLGEQLCSDTEYYDPDFQKCRRKCQRNDDCFLDELCRFRTSQRCDYLCKYEENNSTCIPWNHSTKYRNRDCKIDGML